MSTKEFFKENLVIVIGVALPLLLVLFFVVARELPVSQVPPPQYDVVFAKNYYKHQNQQLEFSVVGGKLKIRYFPPKYNDQGYQINQNVPELLYFDVKNNSVREIPIELPTNSDGQLSDKVQYLTVPTVENLKLAPGSVAPDGYEFSYQGRSSGGLVSEIMVGGRYRYRYVLQKEGRRVKIPGDAYYYGAKLIGWVVEGELKD